MEKKVEEDEQDLINQDRRHGSTSINGSYLAAGAGTRRRPSFKPKPQTQSWPRKLQRNSW